MWQVTMCAGPERCTNTRGDAGQRGAALGGPNARSPLQPAHMLQEPLHSSPGHRQTQKPNRAHALPAEGNLAKDDRVGPICRHLANETANEILLDFKSLDPNAGTSISWRFQTISVQILESYLELCVRIAVFKNLFILKGRKRVLLFAKCYC